jgi:hypothetical protein
VEARAIVCLGADAAEAMGETAAELVGPEQVIIYPHPARAVPETWARNLYERLRYASVLD